MQRRQLHWPVVALLVFAVGLLTYQVIVLFGACLGHDQAWYLLDAQRLLASVKLYGPQLSETNPPLPIWFSTLPVLLARALHIVPAAGLRLIVLLLIFASTAWCVRVLRARTLLLQESKPAVDLLVALGCAILFLEFDTTWQNFGQREHLFLILALPYILAASRGAFRAFSTPERCALGIAAGIAVCFKPQQALVLLTLELFLAARNRSLRRAWAPEALALLLTGGVYFLLVRTVTPLYLTDSVPLVLEAYWAFGTVSTLALLRESPLLIAWMLGVLLAAILLRKRLLDSATPLALIVCSFASFAAYAIQHKGWAYQRFPCEAFMLLAGYWLLLELARSWRTQPASVAVGASSTSTHLRSAVAIFLLLTAPLCAMVLNRRILYRPQGCGELYEFFGQYKPGTNVFIFSTTLVNFSAVFDHQLDWGSRFACLWLIPAIVQSEQTPAAPAVIRQHMSTERVARLAAIQRTATAEDLNLWKPTVVLVEHCTLAHPCQAIEGLTFEMIPWFRKEPAFAEAWSHYRQQPGAPPDFDLYTRVR